MRRKTWLLLAASLVAVLALGAAGCGGDDDDDDAAGGDTGAATDGGQPAAEQVMTIGWGADPPSLDPGIAEDTTSSHILTNLFDPLVKLNPDTLEAEAALAESWDIEGPLVTFHLREDGTWTNGDPVTAGDFEYAWKRVLDPELASGYSYQLGGIKGAAEYNSCESNCDALPRQGHGDRSRRLHPGGRADLRAAVVHPAGCSPRRSCRSTRRRSRSSASNGRTRRTSSPTAPSCSSRWSTRPTINMVKNPDWRDADSVSLERIDGRIIIDGITRVQAFEAGEVDALDGGGPSARGDRAPEGGAVLRAVSRRSGRTTTASTRRTSPTWQGAARRCRSRSTGRSSRTRSTGRAATRPRA